LASITCNATVAPTINNYTFYNIKPCGSLYYPAGSNYSSWLSNSSYYLGYYNWNKAIVAKFNVTNTSANTTICGNTSSFSQIIVDGTALSNEEIELAETNGYAFENIVSNHTISVEFEVEIFSIKATFDLNGEVKLNEIFRFKEEAVEGEQIRGELEKIGRLIHKEKICSAGIEWME
jgi:hypothetical protein